MITIQQLREKFISYFTSNHHHKKPSASLVPLNDDTLLFTNSGMVQFKNTFLGLENQSFTKSVSVQKCIRAGGKHNDLDNIGYTARHHTFFEMLGNFSFGDYFKRDAIKFAWDFLTNEIKLQKEKLWITIYKNDNETFNIWHKDIGLAPEKIIRMNTNDNFWAMGDTGPCGPCSEIFYDHGSHIAGGLPNTPDKDGDRYIEIWNLVFIQYNLHSNGSITNLTKLSVDTGMGLERLASILQGVHSNYDIDLFQALINNAAKIIKTTKLNSSSLKVIADHIRSCSFLVADGILPANEGRGYVLRRIIRRAVRHGQKLGMNKIFFYKLVNELVKQMGQAYPELVHNQLLIEETLRKEEERFIHTIAKGVKIFSTEVANIKDNRLSGELMFKLYDTHGIPVDLIIDMAKEKKLEVDQATFQAQMHIQKQRSKKTFSYNSSIHCHNKIKSKYQSNFIGYSTLTYNAKILEIFNKENLVQEASVGNKVNIVLDNTPFYAESGGQIGDKGIIKGLGFEFVVSDVQKLGDAILHIGYVKKGLLNINDTATARVDGLFRRSISSNHSATHLLHSALKKILGCHVEQKGSLVDDQKLRFDYSHNNKPLTKLQVHELETIVNTIVQANYLVDIVETSQKKAILMGAQALFNNYHSNDIVRVICIGNFSVELCGGTHVKQTGDIGLFKILSDFSIGSGIRRIEAITGNKSIHHIHTMEMLLNATKNKLKADDKNLIDKLVAQLELIKYQEKIITKIKKNLIAVSSDNIVEKYHKGITIILSNIDACDIKNLRDKIDDYKAKKDKVIIVLSTVIADKVKFVIGVSKLITSTIQAGDIAKFLSSKIDGKGGGRPDMAQGGGRMRSTKNIENALTETERFIIEKI